MTDEPAARRDVSEGEPLSDAELARIRTLPLTNIEIGLFATLDAETARADRLQNAILNIDSHAVPLAEDADGWVAVGYYVPIGPIHKALGVIGHTAVKTEVPVPAYIEHLLATAVERTKATKANRS